MRFFAVVVFFEADFFIGYNIAKMAQPSQPKKTDLKLQTYLAHAGIASRRQAEVLIDRGLVQVNGRRATIGQRVTPGKDRVLYKGKLVGAQTPHLYFLVDKPVGVVSTTRDELGRPTVLSLLPTEFKRTRLYPVGRLDADSQGLMLLTNDGDITHRLTHPSFVMRKTYQVELDRVPSEKALDHLRKGVKLTDGFTQPAEVEQLPHKPRWLHITIHEGRNRQVRRMLRRVGYNVHTLIRTTFGPFTLEQLQGKTFIQLNAIDVTQL